MALKLIAFGTTLISIAILVGVVYLLKDILALVVVSFLIAYVLTPIVDIIERKGINRTLIVIVMTLLILGSFAVVSTIAVSSIVGQFKNFAEDVQKQETRDRLVDTSVKLINRIPELIRLPLIKYLENREKTAREIEGLIIEDAAEPTENPMTNPPPTPESVNRDNLLEGAPQETVGHERVSEFVSLAQESISMYLTKQATKILTAVGSSAKGAFSAFTTGIIILFLTFFLLNGGSQLKKVFIQVVPNRHFEPTLVLIDELDQQLGDYLRSRLVETIALSILFAVGYWILGPRFAILLGIIAGLANLIPYIGPFIGAIPAIIVVFISGPFLGIGWSLLAVLILTLVGQIIDNAIIFPLVVGKSVELGPVTTIVVVLLGAQILGLVGLLMAVPIAAMLKLICQECYRQFKGYYRSILHSA